MEPDKTSSSASPSSATSLVGDDHKKCNDMLYNAVTKNKRVQFLVDSIESLGCKIPQDFFICRSCDGSISGGFVVRSLQEKDSYKPQILLCENKRIDKETFEHTIVHELVHAYDVCRAKVDFKDCFQHACTEIRASSLSGECSLLHEIYRGKYVRYAGGQKACVERRATSSVQMNPNCGANAGDVVRHVFDKCYMDTAPFDSDS